MSDTGVSIPPYVFEQKGTFPAPYTFTVPGSLEIRPDTASAKFDGTGASGPFLACLTFISPDGARLCRMFNPNPVAQGDVAEVTYIPPFGAAASSASGSGIQFDTAPQAGDWLYVETTGSGPNPPTLGTGFGFLADSGGFNFKSQGNANPGFSVGVQDTANGGIALATSDSSQGINLTATATFGPGVELATVGTTGGIKLQTFNTGSTHADITLLQETLGQIVIQNAGTGTSGITINNGAGGGVNILDSMDGVNVQSDASGKLGFFHVAAVTQQATPVTLADVIALLQAYGLSA